MLSVMRRALALIAVVAALTACGVLKHGPTPPDASALISKIGCTSYVKSSTQVFVAHGGTCSYAGVRITIDVFQTNVLRDRFVNMGEAYGAVYGVGDRWVIGGSPVTAVRSATAAAGGTLIGPDPSSGK
jgi:hypothetical protein